MLDGGAKVKGVRGVAVEKALARAAYPGKCLRCAGLARDSARPLPA